MVGPETGAAGQVGDRRRRHVDALQELALQGLGHPPRGEHAAELPGQEIEGAAVHAQGELGCMSGAAELVQALAERQRIRVEEMECLAVEPGLGGDVVECGGDVVDRHQVEGAALEPDQRDPGR